MRRSGTRCGKLLAVTGAALALLLSLGILAGCLHHHGPGQDEDGCALCSLVHVAAVTPPGIDPAPVRFAESGAMVLPPAAPATSEERYTAPPRAPPLS